MHIRQLLAVAALLFISANSLPQPQDDLTPTATEVSDTSPSETGGFGPPTGVSTGFPMGGEQRFEESWKEYAGDHHAHHGSGGGNSGSAELPAPTDTVPTATGVDTIPTATDGGTYGSTAASTAAAATSAASTVTSGKLRRVRAF